VRFNDYFFAFHASAPKIPSSTPGFLVWTPGGRKEWGIHHSTSTVDPRFVHAVGSASLLWSIASWGSTFSTLAVRFGVSIVALLKNNRL